MDSSTGPEEVISFWREAGPKRWFTQDAAFDADIRQRFGVLHDRAARGDLADWETRADGALALVLLLDQFSRNMFRGEVRAFAADAMARGVADRAIARGYDTQVDAGLRSFFFVPFMHSEVLADQQRCVALYEAAGETENVKWAIEHRDIIARFGRFPHRNAILGRAMTAEEQQYLDAGGFKG